METVRYTYRLRLSRTSKEALLAEWDRCRWVWNQCVGRDRDLRFEGESTPSGYDLCAELTDWRGAKDWLRDGAQNAQQNVVLKWGKSRQASFKVKGRGRPAFKSRHVAKPTLEYTSHGFKLAGNRLIVAGKISGVLVLHRDLPSDPKSVTVYRDSAGHWNASFVVKRQEAEWPEATEGIGVDWGVKTPAITTNEVFDLPRRSHAKKAAGKLAKCQRKMARRKPAKGKPNSRGYELAKRETAKIYAQVARQRKHDARQWARRVVANHDLIAVEDFKPKFLAKSTMARQAADNSVGILKAELVRYANQASRTVVLVPPAYTSMRCSECWAVRTKLSLSERTFSCPTCEFTADRDRNAARVILVTAETNGRGVEVVRQC